jgi:glycerol-3-phosphate acyltransferase PlsY
MELLFLPLTAMGFVFILAPFLALVPAIVFICLYSISKRFFVLLAGLLWLVYMPYEYAMKLRILCSGECNIRVDLLLIYPLLLAISAIAIIIYIRHRVKSRRT